MSIKTERRHIHTKKVNRFVVILFFLPLVAYSSATMRKREREIAREKANIVPL